MAKPIHRTFCLIGAITSYPTSHHSNPVAQVFDPPDYRIQYLFKVKATLKFIVCLIFNASKCHNADMFCSANSLFKMVFHAECGKKSRIH